MHTSKCGPPALGDANGKAIKPQHRPLQDMFSTVPNHYDLLNRVLTWGFDERWRHQAASECLRDNPERILDLCCGTGDLSLRMATLSKGNIEIVGLDFCKPMLKVARAKAADKKMERKVTFIHGDAASLPFPDRHFPVIGISFAFRNISYHNPLTHRYLAEIVRMIPPGGKCVILETSQPHITLLKKAYHLYTKTMVPNIGGLLSGQRGAYRYLAESAMRFYTADEVSRILLGAGFQKVIFRPLLWGIAAIHVATR